MNVICKDNGDCCWDDATCFYVRAGAPTCGSYYNATTQAKAVGSLEDAQKCIKRYQKIHGDITTHVEIRIKANAVYNLPVTRWTFYVPGRYTMFIPDNYKYDQPVTRPVFNGNGTHDYWFRFRPGFWPHEDPEDVPQFSHYGGEWTRIWFMYLEVHDYTSGAVYLRHQGNRDKMYGTPYSPDPQGRDNWIGYNGFRNNYFHHLGWWYSDPQECDPYGDEEPCDQYDHVENCPVGQGAIYLEHAYRNFIENNHLSYLMNDHKGMHAVYLHHSSHNWNISGNITYEVGRSPIRVKDYSNDNRIFSNIFYRSGGHPGAGGMFDDFYQDHSYSHHEGGIAFGDCNRQNQCNVANDNCRWQCPSWENKFYDNFIGCNHSLYINDPNDPRYCYNEPLSNHDVWKPTWYFYGRKDLDQAERMACVPTRDSLFEFCQTGEDQGDNNCCYNHFDDDWQRLITWDNVDGCYN